MSTTLFGWCMTNHHGYPNFTADERWEKGLCPGKVGKDSECGCSCHRGVEPEFRARPFRPSNPELGESLPAAPVAA